MICPRCGRPGYLIRAASNKRNFYRVYHKKEGKSYDLCYLGPVGHIEKNRLFLPLAVEGISDQILVRDSAMMIVMDLTAEVNLDSVRSLEDEIRHLQWLLRALAAELEKYVEKEGGGEDGREP